jgi:serine/threonine protein kinase
MGIARGLEYLHGEGVVHGDIKPVCSHLYSYTNVIQLLVAYLSFVQSNVLMGDNNEPLLCDFGRSTILDLRGFTTRPAGAARYQAVELVKGEVTPNKSTDVCAFGLTAFEVTHFGTYEIP